MFWILILSIKSMTIFLVVAIIVVVIGVLTSTRRTDLIEPLVCNQHIDGFANNQSTLIVA